MLLATHEWPAEGADGSAPTVVLVHGVTGWWRTWWRVGPALASAGWHVVAVDLRGHGHSPRIDGYATVGQLAADVGALIEGMGGHVDALIGHSLGGAVAAELAFLRPELIGRLVLEDPPSVVRADDVDWQENLERELLAAVDDPEGEVARELAENPSWLEEDARQDVEGKQLADRPGLMASFRRHTGARVLEVAPQLAAADAVRPCRRGPIRPVGCGTTAARVHPAAALPHPRGGLRSHGPPRPLRRLPAARPRLAAPMSTVPRLTIRDVPGIRVGHWTDAAAATGCTVILADDDGMVAGVDVRGSAPGTRETDLLRPTALVERVNAICLAGGSAFGLGAADGVMRRLAERGVGFVTPVRPVPIVPAAILYDLGIGDPTAFPGPDAGHAATLAAESSEGPLEGRVGAGTGATVAKLGGAGVPAGIGSAARRMTDGHLVGALVANNCLGNVMARDGRILARGGSSRAPSPVAGNTVLVVVATDAALDRAQCQALAGLAHDTLARLIRPVHTMWDGDVVFAVSSGDGSRATLETVFALSSALDDALGEAIERSVRLDA